MTRWIRTLASTLGVVLGLMSTAASAQTDALGPEDLIKKVSTEVLTTIQSDKSLQDGDIQKIIKLVDEKIVPVTDFDAMTRLSVGPAWRNASAAQRDQLIAAFKQLLVRTYSGAFSEARSVKLSFKPSRIAAEDTDVIVRSQVVQPGADPIQLDYRLRKGAAGWKIYDVNVLGAWVVQTYRDSFGQEINKGGIDGLIKALNDKNAQFAKK